MEFHRCHSISHIILNVYIILNIGFFTHSGNATEEKLIIDQNIEDAKINYLIERVKNSKAIVIRNGSKHSCHEAAEHLTNKMKRGRRTFGFFGSLRPMKVETFIEKIASKSSLSGEPYKVILRFLQYNR